MHTRRENCMLWNQGWGTPGFAYARNRPRPLPAHFRIVTVLNHSLRMDVTLHPSRNARRHTHIEFTQARICFIFHYYGRFLFSRFTESSITSGEERGRSLAAQSIYHRINPIHPAPAHSCFCIVCRILHPSHLVLLRIILLHSSTHFFLV